MGMEATARAGAMGAAGMAGRLRAHLQLLAFLDELLARNRARLELGRLQLVLRLLLLALGLLDLLAQPHDLRVHRRVEQQRRRLRVRWLQRLPQLANLLLQIRVLTLLERESQHERALAPAVLAHVPLHPPLRRAQLVHIRLERLALRRWRVVRHRSLLDTLGSRDARVSSHVVDRYVLSRY